MIWNEANSDTFWLPREGAAADYAALLARCWDLLHAFIPGVNILTTTASSHDPAAFIRDVGAAYRASGRQRPLFDAAGHNPYPLFPGEPPTARHQGTSARATTTALSPPSTSPSPGPRSPRHRSGTSRTASRRRRSENCAARTTPAARRPPGRSSLRQANPDRRCSPACPLPASRRRLLQLPARRRDAARRLAVRPALGRLEA